ncbi:MAG: CotH kinase family protein [Verrucomicrobiia bacterium]
MVMVVPFVIRSSALLAIWLFGVWGGQTPARAASISPAASEEFFTQPRLTTFEVELTAAAQAQLTRNPKRYVPGQIAIDGRRFEVGVRLQGSGNFEPLSRHPNLTIKFNWMKPGQEFGGVTKLFLKNARQDPTLLCEVAASAAFADVGLPAPRITHGRVRLNDRDLGLCVVAEAVNKPFLRRHFKDEHGALYEGAFRDVRAGLDQDNGPPSNGSDLAELGSAARVPDRLERLDALSKVLDVEAFLNFLAMEMIVASWDGYALHQNNYRIYHDPVSDRMFFIPHGMDNTFFESGFPLMPPRKSLLVAALLESAEDREAFRARVARLLPKALDRSKMEIRVQSAVNKMKQGATSEESERIERRAALFQKRVRERVRNLEAQLAGERPFTPDFGNGGARLDGWMPKPDWNSSPTECASRDGRQVLTIRATNGFCFGSWRLPMWLEPGRYRLEALGSAVRVDGLSSRTGSGVGVRVLGKMRGGGLEGSSGWVRLAHDFEVQEGCEWVELIAELRALRGTAAFDAEKFRLSRIAE